MARHQQSQAKVSSAIKAMGQVHATAVNASVRSRRDREQHHYDGGEAIMTPVAQQLAWRSRTPEIGEPMTAMSASSFDTSHQQQHIERFAQDAREEARRLEDEALQLQFRASAAAAEEAMRHREELARVAEAAAAGKIAAMLAQKEDDARRVAADVV